MKRVTGSRNWLHLLWMIGLGFTLTGSGCTGDPPKIPVRKLQSFKNSIGIEFVLVPAGYFIMGEAPSGECRDCKGSPDETPRHYVHITRPFYISKYEITQEQWNRIMGASKNPSLYKGADRPVEYVTWYNVMVFIEDLNKKERTRSYRLPTEAEWEYAARAGTKSAYSFGENAKYLGLYTWYVVNSGLYTHKVGLKAPNPWGLYDMYGNVFEWCSDWYLKDAYRPADKRGKAIVDPKGPENGADRVRRGGGFGSSARICRSSDRDHLSPQMRASNTGFRLVKQ